MSHDLPTGTVTFLFTDIEGSTKLLHELGAEQYAEALADHRRILRDAFTRNSGVEVDTQGDAFFVAFPTAPAAIEAARQAQESLADGPIRVRIGIHTGSPLLSDEGYIGPDVHRAARITAAGHGGQILVSASSASLLPPAHLLDLGDHRLKDLSAPERIFQLGQDDFPPLKTLYQTNLPIPTTPFLGRDHELIEVRGLLSRGEIRLLTLTGPGGTGKTRLATHAAGLASENYPHGVWWVPLAPLRDPDLVLETAGRVLGAKDGPDQHIGDKSMLLLFDNFEHVVGAAPRLMDLLSACPNIDVLVTSREPLRVSGEQEYPVPPLLHDEAVGFFTARASAVKPDFQADDAVPEICRRVDELPLALELAAARVKAFSPRQILERLEHRLPLLTGGARDAPERQRTLRATIEWSYDLLTEDEQRLYGRLAGFRGGCTLESAEAVAEADIDSLQSLVDKSLLRWRAERYLMLETIREYAAERLERTGEADQVKRRHAEYFLAFAAEAEPHLRQDSIEWLDRLQIEHDNVRAALDCLEDSGDYQLVLQLAGAVSRFWYMKGHLMEGQRRLEKALGADHRPTPTRAKALDAASVMALNLGDPENLERAQLRAEEALVLHRSLEEPWGVAYSTMMIGNALSERNEQKSAVPHYEESIRLFRELVDDQFALIASSNLAWALGDLGDRARERELHEENLRLARELGNDRMEAAELSQLGKLMRDEGRLDEAAAMFRDSIRTCHRRGDPNLADELAQLASVIVLEGSPRKAAILLASSESLTHQLGRTTPIGGAERNEKTLAHIRAHLDEGSIAEAWEQGRKLSADEAVALALGSAD